MFKDKKFKLFIIISIILFVLVNKWIYSSCIVYGSVIRVDGIGYYAYLPATFIYKDISFAFLQETSAFLVNGVNRYPLGVSICWLPYFLMAEFIELFVYGNITGYGIIYERLIQVSAIVFWGVGICSTYWLLCKNFTKEIALQACILITFGTRLFHYSSIDACLSHVYSFAMIAMFCVAFYKYSIDMSNWKAIVCGILLGLITDLRNVNIIIAIVPIMYILGDCFLKKDKYKSYRRGFFLAIIGFFISVFPMLLYWRLSTGHWIYNSYLQWSFDWLHPQIIKTLFGEDPISGMIKLSPLLLVILPGGVLMLKDRESNKHVTIGIFLCLALDFYIVCASWAPAGIGRRAYVNYLTLVAWPLAYFLQWIRSFNKKQYWIVNILLFVTVIWNGIEMVRYWFWW